MAIILQCSENRGVIARGVNKSKGRVEGGRVKERGCKIVEMSVKVFVQIAHVFFFFF